jgi:nucleoside 2-deoxyribosyltransferase
METCRLTGLPVDEFENWNGTIRYNLKLGDAGTWAVRLCSKCFEVYTPPTELQRAVIGLIINNRFTPSEWDKIHLEDEGTVRSNELVLSEFLSQAIYPKSTKDRRNHFFRYLASLQPYDCGEVALRLKSPSVWGRNYYLNESECIQTYGYFVQEEFLLRIGNVDIHGNTRFRFTHNGLNELDRLTREENQSNYAFVAMSFSEGTEKIRAAIVKAIESAGFDALVVDEVRTESDRTIPDKIFASIRQSRFCVADFTQQKRGVYFEAGFAVGLGIPVLYTCERKDFENAHFDIKQLQQILYDSPEDLQQELESKIKAWIR